MTKNPQATLLAEFNFCGVTEIRTRDTLLGYTRFPGVPLQPLEHHSFGDAKVVIYEIVWEVLIVKIG